MTNKKYTIAYLLNYEQCVQVERHVVEPPLAVLNGGVGVHGVLHLVPELLYHGR